jgi:hypothetical protein
MKRLAIVAALLAAFPPVDIFLAHNSPQAVHTKAGRA